MAIAEALDRGLREALERVKPRPDRAIRGVLGDSPSTGRVYHAVQWLDTGEIAVLLLPRSAGAAGEVNELPDDVVWEWVRGAEGRETE